MSSQRGNSKSPSINKSIRKQNKDSDSSSSEKRYGKFWKPNEDTLLLELHRKYNGNWRQISEEIPGRNLSQCQQRWKRINPNKTKLRKQWTDEEDKKVFELVQEYGRNWKVIEGFMEGRSSKQIRERFLNNLDPEINRSKFTAQEDKIILEQYRIYGPKWSEIAKMLDRRPENQVKNRFYSYIKRVSMLEEKSDDEDNDGESSISEQPHIPPPIQIYQPLETIQSIKEEHDNTKNDSLKNESFINVQNRTPSNRIQPSINLIQGLDSFDSKQFDGIHSQDISPFHQRRILNEYSPINFEYANHHPTFDNIQEDVKELRSQIECISLEKIN
ncbi:unnamed protein product [Paramecium primaurelia]|uniref:Myb-like DNA-binding domain containing protein n=2 Tax=Paramecium TaxID=5884 RepID=A0A8S1W2E8_9CILI|nr:unnamed protein product [Paramecium primaurelia]CAD8180326.1 unnamed protein product [Paramecium pentaurelia]